MSAKKNKTKSSPEPHIRNAADFRSIYVNFAQTAANPTDITLGVGEAGPTQTGVVEIEMKARLVMAPMQAKIVLGMLFHIIRQYEAQFGKIEIPSVVASQLTVPVPVTSASGKEGSTEGD
jgi:hypothetical protein